MTVTEIKLHTLQLAHEQVANNRKLQAWALLQILNSELSTTASSTIEKELAEVLKIPSAQEIVERANALFLAL